jgi:NAD(P)-dependent dehydrogenase (short-subunit alcohol dehydrogenase family)
MMIGDTRITQIFGQNPFETPLYPTIMDRPVVLITGANTGLGLEIVKALIRSSTSYTILLEARNKDKAYAAIQQLRAEFPNSTVVVTAMKVDLEDDMSIERAFNFVADRYGRVDVLINNAGRTSDKLDRSMLG